MDSLKVSLEQKNQENLNIRAQYEQLATSYNQNQTNQVNTLTSGLSTNSWPPVIIRTRLTR
jgi:hypothetical protein